MSSSQRGDRLPVSLSHRFGAYHRRSAVGKLGIRSWLAFTCPFHLHAGPATHRIAAPQTALHQKAGFFWLALPMLRCAPLDIWVLGLGIIHLANLALRNAFKCPVQQVIPGNGNRLDGPCVNFSNYLAQRRDSAWITSRTLRSSGFCGRWLASAGRKVSQPTDLVSGLIMISASVQALTLLLPKYCTLSSKWRSRGSDLGAQVPSPRTVPYFMFASAGVYARSVPAHDSHVKRNHYQCQERTDSHRDRQDGALSELYFEDPENTRTLGDIYLGCVRSLRPSIEAAFIDIGQKQDAFLHYSDLTRT